MTGGGVGDGDQWLGRVGMLSGCEVGNSDLRVTSQPATSPSFHTTDPNTAKRFFPQRLQTLTITPHASLTNNYQGHWMA